MVAAGDLAPDKLTRRAFLRLGAAAAMAAPAFVAAAAREKVPDSFELWQQGAFRGANVMQPQCTPADLSVLRSWGANLAEIPVSNVRAPQPPYEVQPKKLAELDAAVTRSEEH